MLKENRGHWRGVCLLLVFLFVGGFCSSYGDNRSTRQQSEDSRKEQLRKEAQQSYQDVEKLLIHLLEKVNKNQRPEGDLIENATTTLKDCKRDSLAYEDDQRADYMLLQAWTDFYQGNLHDALNWSMHACKTDDTDQDAWISQTVFSLLSDKRPISPRNQKPQKKTAQHERNNNTPATSGLAAQIASLPALKKGTLEFDLTALDLGEIKERFEKLGFQEQLALMGGFDPNENTLCLLFWRADEPDLKNHDVSDANDVAKKENRPKEPGLLVGMVGGPPHKQNIAATSIEGQQEYFGKLFRACKDHKQIIFLQINTNRPEIAKKIAEEHLKNPESKEDAPLICLANFGVDTTPFATLDETGPVMLIIGDGGKLKYAGPATTFVPAFILSAITDVELDLEKMSQAEQIQQPQQASIHDPNNPVGTTPAGKLPGILPRVSSQTQQPADPNAPASKQGAHYHQLSPEDEIKAGKLLQLAHLEIEESRTVRGSNPKEGIEACRKILTEYGDTMYAKAARELLRKVPQKYKEEYGITDEELGL